MSVPASSSYPVRDTAGPHASDKPQDADTRCVDASVLASRQVVCDCLVSLESASGPSGNAKVLADDQFNRLAQKAALSGADRAFAYQLMACCLRDWWALNGVIEQVAKRPLARISIEQRVLLRMGIAQIATMASVPNYAAVSSILDLAQLRGSGKKTRGFLNANLQSFIRAGGQLPDEGTQWRQYWPEWFVDNLSQCLPEASLKASLTALRQPSKLTIRVNTLKKSVSEYQAVLAEKQIKASVHPDLVDMLILPEFNASPATLPGFDAGWVYVQNPSSARVAHLLNPQPGWLVVDGCAAPGSKATHCAALMQNTGRVVALDVSGKRLVRLQENIERLGASCIEPYVADVTDAEAVTALLAESSDAALIDAVLIDAVLIDVPCSATGTLNKHPDALVGFTPKRLESLTCKQRQLLRSALDLCKPGGVVVYSTCSLLPQENGAVVQAVLAQMPHVSLVQEETILPTAEVDGFYMARLQKALI